MDELMRYGVLGMKWGVRRNPKRAFIKAQKKTVRLDNKSQRAQRRAFKNKHSILTSKNKADEYQHEADRVTYKAYKWYKKVEKTLGSKAASQMENEGVNMGKRYVDWYLHGTCT